jgi:iron complex transport system ATP-binding protein
MTELVLRFEDLGHCYRANHWVFRHYTASIEKGRVFALLGPNGRGKSTLLHLLLGVLPPTEGRIALHGRTAFVPQLFEVSFDYTALDMVLMGRARKIGLFAQPSAVDEAAALAALDRVGLADSAGQAFHELSGGQRQLVILARALVAEADILILDEPTSSLDLKNQGLLLGWIARLARDHGHTVIFTTHHPHHALAVADEVLLMLDEQKYRCGAASDILTEENLKALYGIDLKRVIFEHAGETVESFVPVFPRRRDAPPP